MTDKELFDLTRRAWKECGWEGADIDLAEGQLCRKSVRIGYEAGYAAALREREQPYCQACGHVHTGKNYCCHDFDCMCPNAEPATQPTPQPSTPHSAMCSEFCSPDVCDCHCHKPVAQPSVEVAFPCVVTLLFKTPDEAEDALHEMEESRIVEYGKSHPESGQ